MQTEGSVPDPALSASERGHGAGVRISGTELAGHEVTVNDGPAVIASSDQLDLMVLTPTGDDCRRQGAQHL